MKAFLLLNLFISEALAVYQIFFRQASKSFFLIFMIAVAVFAGEGWYAMQIYDDKKRFVHYNLFFLLQNAFFCAVTICGNNSVWTIVLIAAMILAVIVCLFIIRKKYYVRK